MINIDNQMPAIEPVETKPQAVQTFLKRMGCQNIATFANFNHMVVYGIRFDPLEKTYKKLINGQYKECKYLLPAQPTIVIRLAESSKDLFKPQTNYVEFRAQIDRCRIAEEADDWGNYLQFSKRLEDMQAIFALRSAAASCIDLPPNQRQNPFTAIDQQPVDKAALMNEWKSLFNEIHQRNIQRKKEAADQQAAYTAANARLLEEQQLKKNAALQKFLEDHRKKSVDSKRESVEQLIDQMPKIQNKPIVIYDEESSSDSETPEQKKKLANTLKEFNEHYEIEHPFSASQSSISVRGSANKNSNFQNIDLDESDDDKPAKKSLPIEKKIKKKSHTKKAVVQISEEQNSSQSGESNRKDRKKSKKN